MTLHRQPARVGLYRRQSHYHNALSPTSPGYAALAIVLPSSAGAATFSMRAQARSRRSAEPKICTAWKWNPLEGATRASHGRGTQVHRELLPCKPIGGRKADRKERKCRRTSGWVRGRKRGKRARKDAHQTHSVADGSPSQEGVGRHHATHIPHKPWCPTCMSGRARDRDHKRRERQRRADRHMGCPGRYWWRGEANVDCAEVVRKASTIRCVGAHRRWGADHLASVRSVLWR